MTDKQRFPIAPVIVIGGCGVVFLLILLVVGAGNDGQKRRSPQPAKVTDNDKQESGSPPDYKVVKIMPGPRPFRIINNEIVTDRFEVRYNLSDDRLTLALDTDLGDAAELMVSVSRVNYHRGSDVKYVATYFSEKSTVGEWREPRTIRLDHDILRRQLEVAQRVWAAGGEPFTVSRMADNIDISFVVPVNQDPPFEQNNANLTGAVVTQSGDLRLVEWDAAVPYPIDATNIGQAQYADPRNLASGTTYQASGDKELPLIPTTGFPDTIAEMLSVRRLSPDTQFTVLERVVDDERPWYRVRTAQGEGWMNSVNLLGRNIEVVP